jgi:hypothetical protein
MACIFAKSEALVNEIFPIYNSFHNEKKELSLHCVDTNLKNGATPIEPLSEEDIPEMRSASCAANRRINKEVSAGRAGR